MLLLLTRASEAPGLLIGADLGPSVQLLAGRFFRMLHDDKQVVATALQNLPRLLLAGVQGIGRRDRVTQIVAVKDGVRRPPLVHFDADFHLVIHQPAPMAHQAGQMHQLAVGTGAAHRLAIQRLPHQMLALLCDDAPSLAAFTSQLRVESD